MTIIGKRKGHPCTTGAMHREQVAMVGERKRPSNDIKN